MAKQSHIQLINSSNLFTKYEQTAKGKGVIASPLEYDELMRIVPRSKLITIEELKLALAKKHKVDYTCPQATGFYINMVANAAVEQMVLGSRNTTPYWRTLKKNGELNERYPGGLTAHRMKLEQEGHTIVERGKKFFVEQYHHKLHVL